MKKIKRMLKNWSQKQLCSDLGLENWDLLPASEYEKYSKQEIREMERQEIKRLRQKIENDFYQNN